MPAPRRPPTGRDDAIPTLTGSSARRKTRARLETKPNTNGYHLRVLAAGVRVMPPRLDERREARKLQANARTCVDAERTSRDFAALRGAVHGNRISERPHVVLADAGDQIGLDDGQRQKRVRRVDGTGKHARTVIRARKVLTAQLMVRALQSEANRNDRQFQLEKSARVPS